MKFKNDIEAQADISVTGDVNIGGAGQANRKLKVHGNASIDGGLYLTGASTSYSVEVGQSRSVEGVAFLDLTGEVAPDDYGLRMIRYGGLNAESQIIHTGTANLTINAQNGADTVFTNTNVGIGSTNPQAQLNVVAGNTVRTWTPTSGTSAIFESSNSSRAFVSIVGANQSELLFGDAGSQFAGRVRYNHSDNKLSLWASASQYVTLDSTGNLGIGTDSPGTKLEVAGTIKSIGTAPKLLISNTKNGTWTPGESLGLLEWYGADASGGGPRVQSSIDVVAQDQYGANFNMLFKLSSGSGGNTELMRIEGTGNVGIGTDSPGEKLTVSSGGGANGDCVLLIEADTDNTVETSNAILRLKQDGGAVTGALSLTSNNEMTLYNEQTGKLFLGVGNSTKMTIDNNGDVGIGTTNPGAKLEVYGSSPNILINNTAETDSGIVFTDADAGTGQRAAIKFSSSDNKLKFFVNDEVAQRMVIDTAGYVGIGTTNPSYQLQLSTNSAAKPSSSTWTVVSDERVKENIKPYEKGLNEILQVNTKTFDYNGKAGFDKIKDNVGIIAQDMIKIFPETIKTYNAKLNETDEEETELYNFDGHALTFALINAVKELKAEIEELKKQINK